MIGKVLRGTRHDRLIYYLYGPGRANEHTRPHIVAGWRHPAELEPPQRPDGKRDFRHLNGLLAQPLAALRGPGYGKPVWHCIARAAPGDPDLPDDTWAEIASQLMHHTGLAPFGQEDDAVRWVAIHHGGNHIHIVATLARQDGRRPRVWNDFYRVREACRAAEQRYGLHLTAPGDRTAAKRPTRAENEQARRRNWAEPPRVTLRRHVTTAAASAATEQEFFAALQAAGVNTRLRHSTRTRGEVTGYAVALPGHTTKVGGPVWYGGGKLAADLTLPKLRRRWKLSTTSKRPTPGLTDAERQAFWEHAARTAADAAAQLPRLAITNPDAAADAAWAASDTLHIAAAALGSPTLRRAADAYDRAARTPYGRLPQPAPIGDNLRTVARMLRAAGYASRDHQTIAQMAFIAQLAALIAAVAELRQAQQRAAQAAAARTAAERLRASVTPPPAASPTGRTRAPTHGETAADLAGASFPAPPYPTAPSTRPGQAPPAEPGRPRPTRAPRPHRPRGPTR